MGVEWIKNMCGVSLDDEEMQRVSFPKIELATHVTVKTVQSFGLLGTLVVGPIVAASRSETRNQAGFQQKMTSCGTNGLIIGAVLGPVLTYMKIRNETDGYKIWDRCYRLRYNRNQVRVDRLSIVGAASGAALGAAYASNAMFGCLVGMSSGVIIGTLLNNI